jgi:hypothetical protein
MEGTVPVQKESLVVEQFWSSQFFPCQSTNIQDAHWCKSDRLNLSLGSLLNGGR